MNNSINTISILILWLAFLTMAVLALYLPKITEGISNIIVKKIRGKK